MGRFTIWSKAYLITRILITVKTYPSLSNKYGEVVCTAGFTEDGKFIRVYPIPFRKLEYELHYKKYQWVEMNIEKNKSDFRPESYKLIDIDSIKLCNFIESQNNWYERKEIILKGNIYTNLTTLIDDAKNDFKLTSLAVFKPKNILTFLIEPATTREWDKDKVDMIVNQGNLFDNDIFKLVNKLPYKFSYTYEDETGKQSTQMIEDWEIGSLYWNCLKDNDGDEDKACLKVREKYEGFIKNNDIYFYLGTTLAHHKSSRNPFVIIGVFYPKKEEPTLF